jgi:hypothetical protein
MGIRHLMLTGCHVYHRVNYTIIVGITSRCTCAVK